MLKLCISSYKFRYIFTIKCSLRTAVKSTKLPDNGLETKFDKLIKIMNECNCIILTANFNYKVLKLKRKGAKEFCCSLTFELESMNR